VGGRGSELTAGEGDWAERGIECCWAVVGMDRRWSRARNAVGAPRDRLKPGASRCRRVSLPGHTKSPFEEEQEEPRVEVAPQEAP
jgi:hypothetical protein